MTRCISAQRSASASRKSPGRRQHLPAATRLRHPWVWWGSRGSAPLLALEQLEPAFPRWSVRWKKKKPNIFGLQHHFLVLHLEGAGPAPARLHRHCCSPTPQVLVATPVLVGYQVKTPRAGSVSKFFLTLNNRQTHKLPEPPQSPLPGTAGREGAVRRSARQQWLR